MAKAFRIPFFAGAVPRMGRREIQDNQAQVASNIRLTSGQLEPARELVLVNNPAVSGLQAIFKMVVAGADYWLGWTKDVNAAKGPIAGDTTFRTYYTGDNEPRVTNFALATTSSPFPASWYVLGVTPPITAPSVSHAGGTGTAVSRSFVYTLVTQWGEESAPSPPSTLVTGKTDGTWTVAGMDVAPLNTFTVTGGSWAGGTATLTVASTFGLRAGEEISVSSVNPAGYNTTSALITAVTSTTVAYALTANPGAWVSGGSIVRKAPHNTTSMTKNIYWTETSSTGTQYQLVASSVAVATTSTGVAGSTTPADVLATTTWLMPPVDLAGMLFHPSGAAVGFSKNQLCFSQPYSPYAWPLLYRFAVDYDIVGIGIFGTTVLVATKGSPCLATGVDPASTSITKLDLPWPCLSKRGIVSVGVGVMYPAPQGLVLVSAVGSDYVTQGLYMQKEWGDLVPSTFRAAAYGNRYVASYDPGDGVRRLLTIDRTEFASVTTANRHCDVVWGDSQTGKLYVVNVDKIYEWDSNSGSLLTFDWMSKEFVSPERFNPGAAKLDADFTLTPEQSAALTAARATAIAANQALITAGTWDAEGSLGAVGLYEVAAPSFDEAPTDNSNQLQFQLWVDNSLKFSKVLTTSKAFTMPAGYKTDAVAVRVTGNVKVLGVVVAETMSGLKSA